MNYSIITGDFQGDVTADTAERAATIFLESQKGSFGKLVAVTDEAGNETFFHTKTILANTGRVLSLVDFQEENV